MSIYLADWQQFRLPQSDLPPDVIFRVKEHLNESLDDVLEADIKEQLKESLVDVVGDVLEEDISAHRFLLAGVSPVFRAQFYGLIKEEKEIIGIKETTIEAFKEMIDWIYRVPTEMVIERQDDINHLFQVFNIATKYQIWSLSTSIKQIIDNVCITRETYIDRIVVTDTVVVVVAVFPWRKQSFDKTTD